MSVKQCEILTVTDRLCREKGFALEKKRVGLKVQGLRLQLSVSSIVGKVQSRGDNTSDCSRNCEDAFFAKVAETYDTRTVVVNSALQRKA